MPRYFTKNLTADELRDLIWDAEEENSCYGNPLTCLTPTVEKDLKKVHFDTENINKTGYVTLPNGFSYLGVMAGGDWEQFVFFIIYHDGKKLRGYVPKKGNLWNTDTNRSYGCEPLDKCDENDSMRAGDDKNAVKRGLISVGEQVEHSSISHDLAKMEADIQERIHWKS